MSERCHLLPHDKNMDLGLSLTPTVTSNAIVPANATD